MPIPKRTILLTERAAGEVRLTSADLDALSTAHRTQVEVRATAHRDRYLLTPAGVVGTIALPSCRLVIQPKIRLHSFFYLLDPLTAWSAVRDQALPKAATELLDFFAGQLARLLDERAAAGLHRDYREQGTCGPILQGRLDVAAQLREGTASRDRLHSLRDDFTVDVSCNRIARSTGELVLHSALLGGAVRASLQRALEPYQTADTIALDASAFAAAADRRTEAYRPLLDLCRLLAENLAPAASAGATAAPAFLVNMERVFERYVTDGLRRESPVERGWAVSAQATWSVNRPAAGTPDFAIRPDICLARHGRLLLVVDAKWKDIATSPLIPEDAYQVIAYATSLGARRAVLVYPGDCDQRWSYDLPRARLALEIRMLRVAGGRDTCRLSLRRLARALREDASVKRRVATAPRRS